MLGRLAGLVLSNGPISLGLSYRMSFLHESGQNRSLIISFNSANSRPGDSRHSLLQPFQTWNVFRTSAGVGSCAAEGSISIKTCLLLGGYWEQLHIILKGINYYESAIIPNYTAYHSAAQVPAVLCVLGRNKPTKAHPRKHLLFLNLHCIT